MSRSPAPLARRLFDRGSWPEARYVASALRTETVGGALLLGAALLALLWANSPWQEAYSTLRDTRVGPSALHLDLSLAQWASDGLLAVFFLVAGIELKREFTTGDLADRSRAVVPVVAAACGVAVPALLFTLVAVTRGADGDVLRGWAVPTATDIAFALAVLAVISTHLPSALRSFLLTLAVVDDLIAITIIAVFYTDELAVVPLVLALVPLALFTLMLRVGCRAPRWRPLLHHPLVLAVPALAAWALVHAGGIHATVAGVLLGLSVPVARDGLGRDGHSLAETMEHRLRPWSAGIAVPVFAFFAAGVRVVGGGLGEALSDVVVLAVVVGLVLGKALGVLGGTWAVARFTRAELDDDLAWSDVAGLSLLAGVGFTVSLLIGELAYGPGSPRDEHVKLAVLLGSLLAALLAAVVLRRRNRHYRLVEEREGVDDDGDGVPDVYRRTPDAGCQ
ncbi:Na+/H+ antiporter NhaA [Lapillicoccus jejuensis]|uniref:Na(+)/H(+) antiporter NhaA n=1 Tax=Lapillicoccus jejuensis TaxID=402171 RepID=A0A542DXU3_9MICO|nr:Na+/H+ antiporter NhaA [Lapillicoccus jejuensis]TQJ07901.1 sodium/proton antiporter (NhaA family) [Lapillicoccus jejuensis]